MLLWHADHEHTLLAPDDCAQCQQVHQYQTTLLSHVAPPPIQRQPIRLTRVLPPLIGFALFVGIQTIRAPPNSTLFPQ